MEAYDPHTRDPIRLLPSLDSLYPYLLDSASSTKEDKRGVTSDLFQQKHHMFFVRPSFPHSTALAEVRVSPFAIIPERSCDERAGNNGSVQS